MKSTGVRHTSLTPTDIKVIKALADFSFNCVDAGDALGMHKNTVYYYIGHIEAKTGLNPKKFYDLCELLKIIDEREEHFNED